MLKSYGKPYYYLILGLLLWLPQHFYAQEYLFDIQHISLKDGLPERNVNLIKQDKDGFIWGSGQKGLFRYDGYEFDTYKNTELGVELSASLTFFPDDEGLIWYRVTKYAPAPIYILNPISRKWQTLTDFYKKQLPADFKNQVIRLHDDPKLGIIFITKKGQFFSYKAGKITLHYEHYTILENEKPNEYTYISYFVAGEKDNYWFYHQDTVFQVLPNKTVEPIIAPHPLTDIFKIQNDIHLIYGPILTEYKRNRKHFAILKKGQIVPYDLPSVASTSENSRFPLVEDALGFKWHKELNPSNPTVACITADNRVIFEQAFFENDNLAKITSIYVDRQNNCWVATSAGIFKITRREIPFKHYLKDYSTRGIFRLNNQLLINTWTPTDGMPIQAVVDINSLEQVLNQEPIIQYAFFKEKDYLWTGTNENQLLQKNLKNNKTSTYYSPINVQILIPYQYKKRHQIWIGSSEGLLLFDKKTTTFKRFNSSSKALNTAYCYSVNEMEDGLWWATSKGLFLLDADGDILETLDKASGFRADQMNYIHKDKDDIYWIGTRGDGLIRWNRATNEKTFIGRKDGFLNENIYAVFESPDSYRDGFLWMPSDYGLIRFNKETFEVNTYLPEHGLLHEEFNTYSYHQDKEGNFYFGGLGGVIGFHPKDIVGNTNIEMPLHFKAFKILKNDETEMQDITETVFAKQNLTIQPNDKLFEIYFTLMDFKKKDKLYAYKIEGYDNDWNYTTDNFIRINSLPYGTYELQVRGQIDGTTWTKKHLTMTIKIIKPFYLQTWFMLLSILSLGLGFGWFTRYRTAKLLRDKEILENTVQERTAIINKQSEALKELDKAKTNFFSNITHEFRTPLTLIIGPVQQMAAEPKASFLQKRLNSVAKNAQHLLNLINQLLDISKLEGGQMQVEVQHGDIVAYTQTLLNRLQPLAHNKGQTMRFFTNQPIWKTHFDEKKWQKITFNLLSNAIKYTPNGGTIQLSLAQTTVAAQDTIHLAVQDNGIGIKAGDKKNLFNRFYQIDGSTTRVQEGTGIGLALVKELVELQGGSIAVHSEIGKGTTFEVQLPVLKAVNVPALSIEPILEEALILPTVTPIEPTPITVDTNTEKLDLLIIEDNAEMRTYISSCLDASQYNIIEASNGEEGIEKALLTIPDLIISDVMMPKKDGFEVIEAIREDISTSHIPLVLLTAKTALESRLKGFERGADAYLTKPFSPKELVLRIRKLIEIRQALQQHYQNGNHQTDTTRKSFAREDKFITELKNYIVENLTKQDLKGDKIAQHFGLSRTSLYRKLKALTNQSVTEIIRIQRLTKAVELLKTGDFTISEVAYNTGFSSPSHFARAFKKQYGKAPSEMQ